VPYSVAMKNTMLNQALAYYGTLYGSIHILSGVTTPGPTGALEASGGTPAYARKALSIATSTTGALNLSAIPTFDLPAGTYRYLGLWSALTSGVWLGYTTVSQFTLSAQDIYSLLSGSLDLNATASA
jgi:hypothetical protein